MRHIGSLAAQPPVLRRYLAVLLLVSGLGLLVIHAAAGKLLVAAIYDGPLTPVLGHLLEGRSVHDVDHYHGVLAQRIAYLTAIAWAVALLCLPISALRLTITFFTLDFVFIAVDSAFHAYGASSGNFSVSADRGYPELLQYVKEAWIAAAFLVLYIRSRHRVYVGWSALFLYFLVDDAFMVHERLGLFLSILFEFPAVIDLRPQDLGELLVVGFLSTAIMGFIALAYRRAPPSERRSGWRFVALLGVLATPGVGLDMVSIMVESPWLGFLEDAGEMLAMSTMAWYLYRRLVDTAAVERPAREEVWSLSPASPSKQ